MKRLSKTETDVFVYDYLLILANGHKITIKEWRKLGMQPTKTRKVPK